VEGIIDEFYAEAIGNELLAVPPQIFFTGSADKLWGVFEPGVACFSKSNKAQLYANARCTILQKWPFRSLTP
jgi:hypothetical protein